MASASMERVFRRISSRLILVENGDHDIWSTSYLTDLQEWVLVTQTLFAGCAVVEIFTHAAFVANAFDGSFSTSVTLNVLVLDGRLLALFSKLFFGLTECLVFQKIVNSGFGLLHKFILNELL
jgi:hypothetical protein